MRLATLGVAVVLLVGMTPALAHTASEADGEEYHEPGEGPNHEITSDIPFQSVMEVGYDAYVKEGYWAQGLVGPGTSVDLGDGSTQGTEEIEWLQIAPGTSMPELDYEIEVTVHGPAVAALDVFEVRKTGMTPDCPQYLVEEQYPRQGEGLGYAFRVLSETTQHQRATGLGGNSTMEVSLDPTESPEGYIVAVYPQASTSYQADDATIRTEVGIGGDDQQFALREHKQGQQQPDQPFHMDEWVGSLSSVTHCGFQGVGLPLGIGDESASEMPGTGPLEDRVAQLLGTAIEDPAEGQA